MLFWVCPLTLVLTRNYTLYSEFMRKSSTKLASVPPASGGSAAGLSRRSESQDSGLWRAPNTPADLSYAGRRKIKTATPSTIRKVNRSIILGLIRVHQSMSRAELSRRTGISRSNVSDIVDELLDQGYFCEERAVPSGRGRVPLLLSLNRRSHLVLGVSLRPSESSAALAGLTGEFNSAITFKTPDDPQSFVRKVGEIVKQLRHEFPNSSVPAFEEIAISVPGLVHSGSGRILWLPTLPDYSAAHLAEMLQGETGITTTVENDANLAAIAELWLDETGDLRDFVVVCVTGEGVGTGIVMNREVYRGHDTSFSGEFGHMSMDPDGTLCRCGRHGCWELYVRDRATWELFRPGVGFDPARFHELLQGAERGEGRAVNAIRKTAHYLSIGISNIFLALNPEVVILAGQITQVWDLMVDTFENTFSSTNLSIPVRPARFKPEQLYLQGAIYHALHKVFGQPKLGL